MSNRAPHQSYLTRPGSSSASTRSVPSTTIVNNSPGVGSITSSVHTSPPLKDVLRMKQEELQNLQESRVVNAERACEEKTQEAEVLRQQQMKMKEDYEYNLGLLDERDNELDSLDHEMVLLKQQLNASVGREESKKIELEAKFREIQLLNETYRKQESMLQEEMSKLSSRAASIEKSCADEQYTLRTNQEGVIRTLNEKIRQGDLEREKAIENVRNEQHRLTVEREKLSESLLKQKEEAQFVSKSRVLRLEKEVDTQKSICKDRENVFVKFEAQHEEGNKLLVQEREEHLKTCDGYEDTLRKLREQHELLLTEHQKQKVKASREEDESRVLRREIQIRDQEQQEVRGRVDRESIGYHGVEESYKMKFTELQCELDDMRRKYKDTVLQLKEEGKRREELLKDALKKWELRCNEQEAMQSELQQEHQTKVDAARDVVWERDRELQRVRKTVISLETALEQNKTDKASEHIQYDNSLRKKIAELDRVQTEWRVKQETMTAERDTLQEELENMLRQIEGQKFENLQIVKEKNSLLTKLGLCGEEKTKMKEKIVHLEGEIGEFNEKLEGLQKELVTTRSKYKEQEQTDTIAVEQLLGNIQQERTVEREMYERSAREQLDVIRQLEDRVQLLSSSSLEEDTSAQQIMNEYTHLSAEQQLQKARLIQPRQAHKLTTVYDQAHLPQYTMLMKVLLQDTHFNRNASNNSNNNATYHTNNSNSNNNNNNNIQEDSLASIDMNDSMFIYKSPRFALPSQRSNTNNRHNPHSNTLERESSVGDVGTLSAHGHFTDRSNATTTSNGNTSNTSNNTNNNVKRGISSRSNSNTTHHNNHLDTYHAHISEELSLAEEDNSDQLYGSNETSTLDVSTEAQYVARIHDLELALTDALDERDAIMKSSAKLKKTIQSTMLALPAESAELLARDQVAPNNTIGEYYNQLVHKMEHLTQNQELDRFSDSQEDDYTHKLNTVNVYFDDKTTEIEITPQKTRMPLKLSERATPSQVQASNRMREAKLQKQREMDERIQKKNQIQQQLKK